MNGDPGLKIKALRLLVVDAARFPMQKMQEPLEEPKVNGVT